MKVHLSGIIKLDFLARVLESCGVTVSPGWSAVHTHIVKRRDGYITIRVTWRDASHRAGNLIIRRAMTSSQFIEMADDC